VLPIPNNRYALWRLEGGAVPLLHDDRDAPPESLLQAVWQHQRIRRHQLATVAGEPVRVLHPGFLSREGGPDFRGAVIQFGTSEPASGDVEIDLHASGWHAHGHDRNPTFARVILHVVWDAASAPMRCIRLPHDAQLFQLPAPPTLAIRPVLDAPVGELSYWLNSEAPDRIPPNLRGRCSAWLGKLPESALRSVLVEAGDIRFRARASQLQARARQAGWEQALWEALFRALGYKNNSWPMQCVAEVRSRWMARAPSSAELQVRLFGVSGLLPGDVTRARRSADDYLRRLWDQWWREREEFADCILPKSLWRLHGQRPANHPQRRLALASHWLAQGRLAENLERWCARVLKEPELVPSLAELLTVERDEFWFWHWTVRSTRLRRKQPLLGAGRVTDLAVNAILPWLWIRAVEGRNEAVRLEIERRYQLWPRSEDNSLLRFARERLLGEHSRRQLKGASEQQGLIQIVRDFCDRSTSLCEGCRFPDLVRSGAGPTSPRSERTGCS
jgi:hypothetical protein